MRGAVIAGLAALALAALTPSVASAGPEPGAQRRGFRLFARSLGALTINRIYCGLASTGEICVDSTNSSTIGGGFWPKGTADQYIFNTGLQLAGIIGQNGGPWAGDTTGAFFFDPKGTTQHGEEVRPIYNFQNPDDAANWPAAGLVATDASGDIFQDLLKGRVSASQGDIWFMSWDGNPALSAGRSHPLGVLVETRGLGWNFPKGNEDILYFVYTFYNVTSLNAADYAAARAEVQPILLEQAQQFHARNNAAFGITLPTGGYTINNLFAAFATDHDVGSAGTNYASVNLPFALGYTYDRSFGRISGWTFDPAIFSAPFFAGAGFTGVKYLKSPTGAGEIQLYGNTLNGPSFPAPGDPQNVIQLYRYLSGNISVAAGDQPCNTGNPVVTKICFINNTAPFDMRFFQSSTPLTLPPGGFGSIVVAYVQAAPVADASCAPPCDIKPGDATILGDPVRMAAGVNAVDRITGYLGFTDANADGRVSQNEFRVVAGSLLGKSLVAQAVFDAKFLLPFSPSSPDFFLIPGDNKVTVLWRPSPTETAGDPFYAIASQANVVPPGGGAPVPNALYDPNYRNIDVEGYRLYRGRVDAPNSLRLIAQFDYAGTVISDYAGQINPVPTCAPEIAITTSCAGVFDPIAPGVARTRKRDIPLVGTIAQVKLGERARLADGTAIVLVADTAVTGENSGFPDLSDNGVPFVFVDNAVRNNFRYFYAVTAFDVNSWQSGPTNLESPRTTKAVIPVAPASNYENTGTLSVGLYGRGANALNASAPNPTIDATTGKFSGPFPPANAWTVGFGDFVAQLISAPGNFAARLDSIILGTPYNGVAHTYWFSSSAGAKFSIPILTNAEIGVVNNAAQFPAANVDGSLAARYGGNASYQLQGKVQMWLTGPDYAALYGRGCVNGRAGFTNAGFRECAYNGSRWFDGPSPTRNETKNDPISGNQANFSGAPVTNYNNAGELTGVLTIHNVQAYQSVGGAEFRPTEGFRAGAMRAADFNVYWGAGGTIDSVIDVTHNVVVPFNANRLGGTWGILNQSAAQPFGVGVNYDRRAELTSTDLGCVEPLRSRVGGVTINCGAAGATYTLSRTAVPGTIVFFSPGLANARTAAPAANAGFVLWIAGDIFTFELAGGQVPAAGAVWSLRQYVGAISGGNGDGGNYGPYVFEAPETIPNTTTPIRPFTAVGAELRVNFDVVNRLNAVTSRADLSKVHPVPDPYYVTNEFEQTTDTKIIKFVNLPQEAIIRIYSSSGVLVALLEHRSSTFGGSLDWNVRNRNNQVVASGVYFYHIESADGRRVGRMTIVNFAQ